MWLCEVGAHNRPLGPLKVTPSTPSVVREERSHRTSEADSQALDLVNIFLCEPFCSDETWAVRCSVSDAVEMLDKRGLLTLWPMASLYCMAFSLTIRMNYSTISGNRTMAIRS